MRNPADRGTERRPTPKSGDRRHTRSLGVSVAVAGSIVFSTFGVSPGIASASPVPQRDVVTITMAVVGDPGNPSVGVVQTFGGPKGDFVDPPQNRGSTGIYKSCADAPKAPPPCLTVGQVNYTYGIGKFDVTVSQYVTFLNTVDPRGKNLHELYNDDMSPTVWPEYGSVRYMSSAPAGQHYSVAYPEWADKPFNWGDFRRDARFVNSLTNGKVLSSTESTTGSSNYVTYSVLLSTRTETGMYTLANPATTRNRSNGFVLPSNDEWVKAAYYDPEGGGTDSYWAYPTGPFDPPNVAILNPGTGNVENAADQPLATYNPNDPGNANDTPGSPSGAAPTWCPYQAGPDCAKIFPADLPQGLNLPPSTGRTSARSARTRPRPPGAPTTRGATSSRSSTHWRRNRPGTTSYETGATTTGVWPTRRPTSRRSLPSATTRGTSRSSASIPGKGCGSASSGSWCRIRNRAGLVDGARHTPQWRKGGCSPGRGPAAPIRWEPAPK